MPDRPEATFRAGLAEGEIRLMHCMNCNSRHYYPSVVCRRCGLTRLEWMVSSGLGKVYACTMTAADPPAPIAIVELDDGPRVLSTLMPGELAIGTRVKALIEEERLGHRVVFKADEA